MTPLERREFLKQLGLSAALIPQAEAIIDRVGATLRAQFHAKGYWHPGEVEKSAQHWLKHVYPDTFSAPFAVHHDEACNWLWDLKPGTRPMPFFAVWPRGGGKSSFGESACTLVGATKKRKYILYLSGTQAQANKHVSTIESKLGSQFIKNYYPKLAKRRLGQYGQSKGWRCDLLRTDHGMIVQALGLDAAARGVKEDDQRPDLIILDDLDERLDSLDTIAKKIETLTTSILPTGSNDVAILGVQNLIHKNSIFTKIARGTGEFLTDAIVSGPIPALEDFRYERKGRKWVILSGTPTWEGQNLETCERQINEWGPSAFKREAQHDVDQAEPGALFPMYDEKIHVISWSQFAELFKSYDHQGRPRIPLRGTLTRAQDWGTTHAHPCVTLHMFRPALDMPRPDYTLADSVFIYRETAFPKSIYDSVSKVTEIEPVAPTPVGRAVADSEKTWQEGPRIVKPVMSHEASAACNTYNNLSDTAPGYPNLSFFKWNPKQSDGVDEIQEYLSVDKSRPHPFKDDQRKEDETWETGRPRMFLVVADDQVETATDGAGLARLRAELPEYKHPTTAGGREGTKPDKIFDDAVDALRMIASVHMPRAEPMTQENQIERALPVEVRRERLQDASLTKKQKNGLEYRRYFEVNAKKREIEDNTPVPYRQSARTKYGRRARRVA